MKLIAPAIVLSSLCAAKVWAAALADPAPKYSSYTPAVLTDTAVTASDLKAPLDGYGVVIPEWEVEVFPGQPKIKLSGGIERVHAELVRQNPDWNTHYSNHTKRSSLEKRAFDVQGYFCGGRWDYCHPATIEEGIDYLRRVRGLPSLGPGPGNCARVSCSYLSAIWWCNDANEGKTLQGGFNDIADGASFILHNCLLNPGQFAVVSGQAFTTSNWNVIVRFDSDHC